MEKRIGEYDVKTEALLRETTSDFEAHWVVTWLGRDGDRKWESGSCGAFGDARAAKAAAGVGLEAWVREHPLPPL